MKIEYRTPAGSGSYSTLADETDATLQPRIRGFQPAMVMAAQVEDLFQGANVKVFNRGNARWQMRFTIERVHASADAAAAYLSSHAAIFSGATPGAQFDIKVTVGATALTLAKAALTEFQPDPHSDLSTTISYAFIGETYS